MPSCLYILEKGDISIRSVEMKDHKTLSTDGIVLLNSSDLTDLSHCFNKLGHFHQVRSIAKTNPSGPRSVGLSFPQT